MPLTLRKKACPAGVGVGAFRWGVQQQVSLECASPAGGLDGSRLPSFFYSVICATKEEFPSSLPILCKSPWN